MTIKFEAIKVGDQFPAWERGGLNIELFQAYGDAALDGNPMHTDEEYAQDLGNPTVFAQGMLIMAFAAKYLTEFAGPGRIRRLKARFREKTWPGETLRFSATVTGKREEGGNKLADLEVKGETGEDEIKILVEASVICE